MLFCHSPKENICVSVCSPSDNNSSSNCMCLTNCCHQLSLSNLPTENCVKSKKRLTYEITSKGPVSPIQNNGKSHKIARPLRNSTPSMYKFYSKSNSYLKMKRNNSNQNLIFRNQNKLNDVTDSCIENNNNNDNNNKNYENCNPSFNLKRNNSNDFSYVRNNDKSDTNHIINIKKTNFLDKITSFSNRLDKDNANKDKNMEPSMNDKSNNTYHIGFYNKKDNVFNENCNNANENASRNRIKNIGLNFDKINLIKMNYSKKNRFLEKMKKNNEKERKLVDLKAKNLSKIMSGSNIYNKIGNNLAKPKKEKPDYDYMFSDKNKCVNENIDPNKNENVSKSNIPDEKNYINFKDKICFNKNYKKKFYNDNSNLVHDEDNSLYYNYNFNNRNNNDSFDENNPKKDTSVRIMYGDNNIYENTHTIENKNDNDYINNIENKNWNDKFCVNNNDKNSNDAKKLCLSNYYKENINNRNRYGNLYNDELQSNSQNINNPQINTKKYYNNRNIIRILNNKYNNKCIEENDNEDIINNRNINNSRKIRKFDSCDNINNMHRKKNFNFDYFKRNNKINDVKNDKANSNLDDKNENRDNNYQGKDESYNYKENKENSVFIKNQFIQKSNRNDKDNNIQYDNQNDANKKQNIKNNNSVDNIFNHNNKYIDRFNNNYNSEFTKNIKKNNYLNYKYDVIQKDNMKNKYISTSCDISDDIMNHLNFNYDEYMGIYNNDISDYDNLQSNNDSNINKSYFMDYHPKINNKNKNHNKDINYNPNIYSYNSNNNKNYNSYNDPQCNDINNLIRYTDKSYKNKKYINSKNNEKENNNNDKEKYVEEESVDIYNRSFSDYIYNTDKKRKDMYNNNYYEEIIHTKRYKEYMITSPDKNLHKNKSVEIKRNYFFHPNKSNIRNNSEYHRRVCLDRNKYRNIYDYNIYCNKLNYDYGSCDKNKDYNLNNNNRYCNNKNYEQDYNIKNYSKENAYDKVNICNNYNYDSYKIRCRPKNLIDDENRNYSEENIRINKWKQNNSYFDNVNKNPNISSNYYDNFTKNYRVNNRLKDIINESDDFSNKNIQKKNANNEKENIQSNKRFVKIKIFNENKDFLNKYDDKYNDSNKYINNKNDENIIGNNRNNNIQQNNLKEDNENINSNIITKKNVMFEKITFGDLKENDKEQRALSEKEKEMKIKELEEEIKKLKSNYNIMENKYNEIKKENESFKKISTRSTQIENELKECKSNLNSFKRKNSINEEKIKKLENINQELLSEINKYNGRESKDDSLEKEIIKLKDQIKKLERENQNLIFNNNDKKIKFDALLSKHNELLVRYNNLHMNKNIDKIDRRNPIMSVKKDELHDNHLVLTVKKSYGKLNQDIDQLSSNKKSMSMYNSNNSNEYEKMEKNCKILEDENERLKIILNKAKKINNNNISHEYDYMPNANDNNNNNSNELVLSYKKIIDELNNEISSLKEIIEKNKKEIKELKDKLGNQNKNKNNSLYDDEIVIVRKETTVSKSYNYGDESKNSEINNNFSVKKNSGLSEGDIIKYHEIIQDLTNLVLVYENFFFNKEVKPKNNSELQCVLIVEYINRKMRKIKLNTLINLIIYKNTLPKKNIERDNALRRNSNDSIIKTNYKYFNRNKMGNYNERNFSRNIKEDE